MKGTVPAFFYFLVCVLFLTLHVLSSTSSATATSSFSHVSSGDADALLKFKSSIRHDPHGVLAGWGKPVSNPCGWRGVSCSADGRVVELDLNDSGLSGAAGGFSLRPLSSLGALTLLDLSMNDFKINATESLPGLPRGLQRLGLSASGVFGSVPSGLLAGYPNLTYLNLSRNNITGALPEGFLSGAANLQVLDLSYNTLSGNPSLGLPTTGSLIRLDISSNSLSGPLPSSLSSWSSLLELNMSSNGFTGGIPKSFGRLMLLQRLDLSQNSLNAGPIPAELSGLCTTLEELRLSGNAIPGGVPGTLASCSALRVLDLSNNNLTGGIPDWFFAQLAALEELLLGANNISGPVPRSLSACTRLRILDLSSNGFSGSIPPGLCHDPGAALEELRLPDNSLTGQIPPELGQCTRLRIIDFSINYLDGPIPPELGQLQNLERLSAWFNRLTGPIPKELRRCRRLKNLIFNNNFLSGEFPVDVLTNCTELEWVSLTSNAIRGRVPLEFGGLPRLAVLQLGNNSLEGTIPVELGNCRSMVWLDLSNNRLTGAIPRRLGRQPGDGAPSGGVLAGNTLAFVRNVGNSCKGVGGLLEFAGIRPERLLQVPTLRSCEFARLYAGALLSDWTHRHQTLEYLDLSFNRLVGTIPEELGDMAVMQVLDLAHNRLQGGIPDSLGRLRNLGVFDASHNRLTGPIPDSFSNLSFLVQIDVSDNQLSGPIPARGQLSTLPPSQYANNPGLCGVPLPLCGAAAGSGGGGRGVQSNSLLPSEAAVVKRRAAAHAALGALAAAAGVCVVAVWGVARARRRAKAAAKRHMLSKLREAGTATTWDIGREKEPLSINVAAFQKHTLRKLTFSQLIEATNGFSAAALLGSGGFGEVFKATLQDGSCVAVKKLVRLSCQGDREFVAEMETLGKVHHRHLVPLLGYCRVGEERLLVYDFMPHGSLEDALHRRTRQCMAKKSGDGDSDKKVPERTGLTWTERKLVAVGAAKGLCFLHHNCIPHIIHRDMKSSNILLDARMEARVSDFGMARLISALDTHLSVSSLAGTPGYVPPEYYQSFRCTARGDVYSFGVVLLEILSGRRPTDGGMGGEGESRNGSGDGYSSGEFGDTNLVGWVKGMVRDGRVREVFNAEIMTGSTYKEEGEMRKCLEIALRCVEELPSRRPNMVQVVAMLKELGPAEGAGGGGCYELMK